MKIGIGTYSFGGIASFLGLGPTLKEKFESMKALGYTQVELLAGDLDNDVEDIKKWAEEVGVEIVSIHAEPSEEVVKKMAAIGGKMVILASSRFNCKAEAIELAKEEGKAKWGGKIPPNLKLPLRDGDVDRPDDSAYENSYFINATSQEQPGIVDRKKVKISDPLAIYSGCYIRASINIYPFNANGNRGIAAGLSNIQFWEDGEPLNGRVRAEDEFDALDDDDSDDFLD